MKCEKCGKTIPEMLDCCPDCLTAADDQSNSQSDNNPADLTFGPAKIAAVIVFGFTIYLCISWGEEILALIFGIMMVGVLLVKREKSENSLMTFVKLVGFIALFALISFGICLGVGI